MTPSDQAYTRWVLDSHMRRSDLILARVEPRLKSLFEQGLLRVHQDQYTSILAGDSISSAYRAEITDEGRWWLKSISDAELRTPREWVVRVRTTTAENPVLADRRRAKIIASGPAQACMRWIEANMPQYYSVTSEGFAPLGYVVHVRSTHRLRVELTALPREAIRTEVIK